MLKSQKQKAGWSNLFSYFLDHPVPCPMAGFVPDRPWGIYAWRPHRCSRSYSAYSVARSIARRKMRQRGRSSWARWAQSRRNNSSSSSCCAGARAGMATVARGDAGLSPKASCLVGICEEQKRRHDAPQPHKLPVLTDTGRHAAKICHGQLASLFLYLQCPARGGTAGGRSSPY